MKKRTPRLSTKDVTREDFCYSYLPLHAEAMEGAAMRIMNDRRKDKAKKQRRKIMCKTMKE